MIARSVVETYRVNKEVTYLTGEWPTRVSGPADFAKEN
jgi:hypothetical protein